MRAIRLTSAAAALTIVALAGACASPVDHVAGDAAPVTDRPSPSAVAVTTSAPVTKAASSASPQPTRTVPEKVNPCPVKASTLYRALQGTDIFERAARPAGLKTPDCYQGYAFAEETRSASDPADIGAVLFKYNAGTGRWKPVNLGTANVCEGYVSAEVASHFGDGC